MKEPKISVVVPVYKVEKYLVRCVESILSQTYGDFELLLVDDGSPDNCGAMCDAYAEKDSRVRVIHKQNGGLSDARNAGIEAARGQYLCFIDSDDFIDPPMLEVLVGLLAEYGADVAQCGIRDSFEGREPARESDQEQRLCVDGVEALRLTLEGKTFPGSVCTKLIRREICLAHRFEKGKTYEDAFYMPGLFLLAKKVAATTKAYYNYWHRADSITTKPFSQRNMDVVDAYAYTLERVLQHCPQLEAVAWFRHCWGYFVVLDKMLVTKDYKKLPQYKPVKRFLKRNWWRVVCCGYFNKTRRIAALALAVNVGLYRLLVLRHNKGLEVHA